MITDPATGKRKVAWALIIVLSYSWHCFVWPTHSQKLEDVIAGLEAAWAFFGGVPRYLVIDNFPAAVAGPDPLHPRLTRGFLEYSQHRGFVADPARVRHPKDKPKVNAACPTSGSASSRAVISMVWLTCAMKPSLVFGSGGGTRIHGTTRRKPLVVFQDEERHALLPWDGEPYEITHWRTAKVHSRPSRGLQYALYSVPSTVCPPGQKVEIRMDSKLVRIYHRGKLLKIHQRQPKAAGPPIPKIIPPSFPPTP